jgi:hypothetical protein
MLVERSGEPNPFAILEELADPTLEIARPRLPERLDALTDRRADEAQQQVHQHQTDRDLEDLRAEHADLPWFDRVVPQTRVMRTGDDSRGKG